MLKIMLDTNAFDFIFENNLINNFNNLVEKQKIQNFSTYVQSDEIEKISDDNKKNKLKTISCQFIPSHVGFVGIDYESKRGFNGSRVDGFRVVGEEDSKIIDQVKKSPTESHPLGNSADIAISFSAIKENLDYLISDNDDLIKVFEKIKSQMNTKTRVISNQNFLKIMNKLWKNQIVP